MTTPTIAEAYAKHLTAFRQHTPIGVLLEQDRDALIRCVARDARVKVVEVLAEILLGQVGQAVTHG